MTDSAPPHDERAIERGFPIVQLNPLSRRERNAFKPIYKMHKWFARRSSSIFRAILLGAALPAQDKDGAPTDLMDEFYKPHGEDPRLRRPDGTPLRVLDPFMGGGTTVVEALRLGFDVTGIDLNPIAWFIVKGETTPVNLAALDAAYDRLASKVRDRLLGYYKTACPITGASDGADIIYGFWVKQGICVAPECGATTDLFKSYEVARKRGQATLKTLPDVRCPSCGDTFDWELNRCTVTAGGPQVSGVGHAGKIGGKARPDGTKYAFGPHDDGVACPTCAHRVTAADLPGTPKAKNKKVPVHVLVDPTTGDFFEVRGGLPESVTAPVSGHTFAPIRGPVSGAKFTCTACGRKQAIVESARAHGKPLPFRYYGHYAYTPSAKAATGDVAADRTRRAKAGALGLPTNNHKWFAAATAADHQRVADCAAELDTLRDSLPLPTQELYDGYNTNRLVIHQHGHWSDLFGPRQLLSLGLLLQAIGEEEDPALRDALLGAFQSALDFNSRIARYNLKANKVEGSTAAHDFRNPTAASEVNTWGCGHGTGGFANYVSVLRQGATFMQEEFCGTSRLLQGSTARQPLESASVDLIITDPPYAGSVQYAEMSDYFYVWLHHVLGAHYPEFEPEITLKRQEIIEDTMAKDAEWYFAELTKAWSECHRVLRDDGLMVFTFHHKEGDRWAGLLRSLFDAGFYLVAAYPTHSEALNSIVIQATKGITYDIVHVCRKRTEAPQPVPWATLRQQVRREATAKLRELEESGDVLPGPDVWMILLGTALRLFSQHHGQVLDQHERPISIEEGIQRLGVVVREVRGEVAPLPGALQTTDGLSQVWCMHGVGRDGWSRDGLHLELRAYAYSVDDLEAAGLVTPDPNDRGRVVRVPIHERYAAHADRWDGDRGMALIDKLHMLIGAYEAGQNVEPMVDKWRGHWTALSEGVKWIGKADPSVRDTTDGLTRVLESLGDENLPERGGQASFDFGDGS